MENQQFRVLLIGSKTKDARIVSDALAQKNGVAMPLECAPDLSSGMKRMESGGIDVVLLDLFLPDSKGVQTLSALRAQNKEAAVVVLASLEQETLARSTLRSGAQDYLIKEQLTCDLLLRSLRYATERLSREEEVRYLADQLDEANRQLELLANIDPLTQLLNRRGLEMVAMVETSRAQRRGSQLAAILLDCDDFKRINDALGHAVGDLALKEMAKRLRSALRPSDYLGRIGGDEFLILLPDTRFAEGLRVAERVRLAIASSPLPLSSESVQLTGSLGVANVPLEVSSIEEVLTLTRMAVNESKSSGKNRVSSGEVPSQADYETDPVLMDITSKLRRGNCFRTVSLPIYELATNKLEGYELLSRGPVGDFEMPDDFFRVSLENKMLTLVDLQCLKTCLAHAERLGLDFKYHVNLFPSTIIDTPVERLISLFPENVPAGTFCVEITEQQFIGDPSYLQKPVHALREAGICVAIDDVGFGRSSLESLILLEPDIVKIDRKYVSGVGSDIPMRKSLLRLVKAALALGAELVAEGIESADDLAVLKDMGVRFGQGYYWGEPK